MFACRKDLQGKRCGRFFALITAISLSYSRLGLFQSFTIGAWIDKGGDRSESWSSPMLENCIIFFRDPSVSMAPRSSSIPFSAIDLTRSTRGSFEDQRFCFRTIPTLVH